MKSIKRILSLTVAFLMTIGTQTGMTGATTTLDDVPFSVSDSEIKTSGEDSDCILDEPGLTISQSENHDSIDVSTGGTDSVSTTNNFSLSASEPEIKISGEDSGHGIEKTALAISRSETVEETDVYAKAIDAASVTADVTFAFSHSGIEASEGASGYSINETALTINKSGIYRLTGVCADGTVEVKKELTVTLILDNLTLTSANTAPFIFGAATNVTIEAIGTSTLRDTAGSNADGSVIKSKNTSTLTLRGSGNLNLYGNEKNGIKGAADTRVIVDSLTLNIKAVNNALASDGSIVINSGTLDLASDNDAIKSEPDILTDSTGIVTINGGSITAVSAGDGIQASSIVAIHNGTFRFTTGGGYKAKLSAEDSAKGIKADTAVLITGGSFYLDCADDAIHSNGNVTVEGGTFTIYSGDDALHADYILAIGLLGGNGPEIGISSCYEGFESAEIYLYSGTGSITASDDGINAANSDLVRNSFKITVYDGYWYINAGGDGVDANGNIYLYGGVIESFGSSANDNAALDFDSKCYADGGTLLAVGTAGMAQYPSSGVYVGFGVGGGGGGDPWRPGGQGGPGGPGGSGGQGSSFNITSGSIIEVKDSTENVLYSATAVKTANSVIFVTPKLTSGQTYYLYVGGTQVSSSAATGTAINSTVTSVTVSPDTDILNAGSKQKFNAVVNGTNNPSQAVTWTVTGGMTGTSISSDGTLTIALNEISDVLVVKATSIADTSKSATATVTVIPASMESFLEDEVIIWSEAGIIPVGAKLDAIKITPPYPVETVEKVKDQISPSATIIAYYEITLKDSEGNFITQLSGEITIATKLPEGYENGTDVKIYQEDSNEKLIEMESWTEGGYIFYKTNWLETY